MDSEIFKLELLLNQAGLAVGDRAVEKQAHAVAERTGGAPAAAIELPDGTVVTGKNGPLLGAASSACSMPSSKLAASTMRSIWSPPAPSSPSRPSRPTTSQPESPPAH